MATRYPDLEQRVVTLRGKDEPFAIRTLRPENLQMAETPELHPARATRHTGRSRWRQMVCELKGWMKAFVGDGTIAPVGHGALPGSRQLDMGNIG